ncbi:MAG: DUF302 domain-containing protein [Ectothiorhodospiraceae bacterium]
MRILATTLLLLLATATAQAADGLVTMESRFDVATTSERLITALNDADLEVFNEIAHDAGAESVDLELAPTRVVIFGNPAVGTLLMQCNRTAAIDLPMKALIWEEGDTTFIGYNSADYLAERHGLDGCEEPLEKVAGALDRFAGQAAGRE